MPDPIGDLVFNGVASDVYRQSFVNGIQEDTAWRVGYAPYAALRIFRQRRAALVNNASTVLPLVDPGDPAAGTIDAPFSIFDSSSQDRLARSAPISRTSGGSPTS